VGLLEINQTKHSLHLS